MEFILQFRAQPLSAGIIGPAVQSIWDLQCTGKWPQMHIHSQNILHGCS